LRHVFTEGARGKRKRIQEEEIGEVGDTTDWGKECRNGNNSKAYFPSHF
jgi:hypothetical protein